MPFYTEASYENSILELFQDELGYEYVYGPDVERDQRCALFEEVLIDKLEQLNPSLSTVAIEAAVTKLKESDNGDLLQKNITFIAVFMLLQSLSSGTSHLNLLENFP